MGNSATTHRTGAPTNGSAAEVGYSSYDESTINRGTSHRPKPLLKFHSVHGSNIQLLDEGRIARRKESFCKGLVFSNRPIGIDEIVCIQLAEVGTNWSGVLRFGVTNVDPASFRDIELPKFACPDLTSKAGYWAKALAERYSVEKAILHFFVNDKGEMYYGINGVNKGLFLNGINPMAPCWIIVDIYGNSIGIEFVDRTDVQLLRNPPRRDSQPRETPPARSRPMAADVSNQQARRVAPNPPPRPSPPAFTLSTSANESRRSVDGGGGSNQQTSTSNMEQPQLNDSMNSFASANNLLLSGGNQAETRSSSATRTSPSTAGRLHFHTVRGVNVTLLCDDTVAVRRHGEYYLGYVFTERPLRIEEKLVIIVLATEDLFSGSLAFGLTSCDPTQMPASRLPMDSDELLERPEYWVCMKDVGGMPTAGDKLSFHIEAQGQVVFSKNDAPSRVIMHVDTSIPLWAFFDLYGTTRKIQVLDPTRADILAEIGARSYRASSEGITSSSPPELPSLMRHRHGAARPASFNLDSLRVALPSATAAQSARAVESHSSENLPSSARAIPATFTISPTSSTSSSAPLGVDPLELARLRASIARRLSPYAELSRTTGGVSPTRAADTSSDPERSPFAEFLASRRSRQATAATTASSNPSVLLGSSPRPTRNTFAEIFESHMRNEENERIAASTASLTQRSAATRAAAISAGFGSTRQDSGEGQAEAEGAGDDSQQNYNECSICMNSRVNAVIYRCGHMCMCFKCAKETHRRSGDCPICRTPIIDVIRCYQG